MSENDLGIKNEAGLSEPISSNGLPVCADCECRITEDNDSGWEIFTSEGKTQPICKTCNGVRSKEIGLKST